MLLCKFPLNIYATKGWRYEFYGPSIQCRAGVSLARRVHGCEGEIKSAAAEGAGETPHQVQIAKSLYSGFTSSVGGWSMPAATVRLVPCSIRMKEPVRRLFA